ncbi:hypothetical protein [Aquisalimonas sp.]|nr:hypothetical protein [Aquisalimonas sp.]
MAVLLVAAILPGGWFAAQPVKRLDAELRCFLVWALEEARSRAGRPT